MGTFGRSLAWSAAWALSLVAARATPTLVGEFALNGNLLNNVAGGPPLVLLPYLGVSGQVTASGYVFNKNQGLTFSSPSLSTTSYTIEFAFKSNLDSPADWSKLLDLTGVTSSDTGLYIHSSGGRRLQFYPHSDGSPADFVTGTTFDVTLTRDGTTNAVAGYVNGQLRFSFTDGSSEAVITAANNTLTFFVDDLHTSQGEVSGGQLYYARMYSGAMNATEVAALYALGAPTAIPEPVASAAVLGGAMFGLLAWRRRAERGTSTTW